MTKTNPADWIFFADSDLALGQEAIEKGIYHLACFHAHQAVEKYLKAVLAWKAMSIPKLHSLRELFGLTLPSLPQLAQHADDFVVLDQYYIPTRYPDALPGMLPEGLPTEEQARQAIDIATQLSSIVKPTVK